MANVHPVRLVIRAERCEGHGRCYDIAPQLFKPDDEGHSELATPDGVVAPEHAEHASAAVWNCPERALSLER
jgi:ferredoxin